MADCSELNILAKNRINPEHITILRLLGSLKLDWVPETGIMHTLQIGDIPTRLGQAMAEIGHG